MVTLSEEMESIFQTLSTYPLFKYVTGIMFSEWDAEGEDGSDVWDEYADILTAHYVKREQESGLKGT